MHHPLSQRELVELTDRLLTHEALIEKAGYLASQAQNAELQQIIRRHQQTHVRHYNDMLSILQQSAQRQGSESFHFSSQQNHTNFGQGGIRQ